MCIDHPEFRARLQTISVKHMGACNFWRAGPALISKFIGQDRRYGQSQRPKDT